MGYSRTLESRQNGPVTVVLYGYNANIDVTADPNINKTEVTAYTEARSGSTVELIDKLSLKEGGGRVELRLPKAADGGNVMISGSGVVISSGGGEVFQVGNGMTMSSSFGGRGGRSRVVVNGNEIITDNGRTWVNGVEVTDQAKAGSPAGDPPMPVHLRVRVPAGSTAEAETYNGNISTVGVGEVDLESYNGDVSARGLTTNSRLTAYNGDLRAGGVAGHRPTVKMKTYNGDVRVLDDHLRAQPTTRNGDVIWPR